MVAKLFLQCRPDFALFGEKDFQQLKVVTRLARDLDLRLRIVGVPTVRERDASSPCPRAMRISARPERAVAPVLYRTLKNCVQGISNGSSVAKALAGGRKAIAAAGFALVIWRSRNAETLGR